ncbi:hypothetical protein ACFQZ2_10630 [Streptomonospora algeriensis]
MEGNQPRARLVLLGRAAVLADGGQQPIRLGRIDHAPLVDLVNAFRRSGFEGFDRVLGEQALADGVVEGRAQNPVVAVPG